MDGDKIHPADTVGEDVVPSISVEDDAADDNSSRASSTSSQRRGVEAHPEDLARDADGGDAREESNGASGNISDDDLDDDDDLDSNAYDGDGVPEFDADMTDATQDDIETWEDPCPELSLDDLRQRIAQEKVDNARLRRETDCLQRYYDKQKVDMPHEDEGMDPEQQLASQRSASVAASRRRSRQTRSSTRQGAVFTTPTALTAAQKGDILQKILDSLKGQLQSFKDDSMKQLHKLQASIAEAEVRLMEVPNLMALFDNDVTASQESSRSNKVETETLELFYKRRMKAVDDQIDKMRVKNVGMKKQKVKTEVKLKQKDELTNQLHKVDFEQLKIENEQFAATIKARNAELSRLKATGGRINQQLSTHKDDLRRLLAENSQIEDDIKGRHGMRERVAKEMTRVTGDLQRLTLKRGTLKEKADGFKVPDVLDLVKQQATLPKLNRSVKTMQKKYEIAQMELRATKRSLRQ